MNDELVTANAAVVSKLLVIAPYSADRFPRPSRGVQTGENQRKLSFTAKLWLKNTFSFPVPTCRALTKDHIQLRRRPSPVPLSLNPVQIVVTQSAPDLFIRTH